MDWEKIKGICLDFIQKYRYAVLLLLVGILLLINPSTKRETEPISHSTESNSTQLQDLQSELEALLSKMEGAGKVKVLLTESLGSEICYQTNEDLQTEADSKDIRRETVIVTSENRAQQGLIQRIDPPVYLGAVVLSQGADSAAVRLSLVEAVKSATGLPANKITVLKMK